MIWTTPWPDQKDLFLKLFIWNNSKFPYENPTFFLVKLYHKFFSFNTLGTHGILHTQFGLIWTTPWSDEKDLSLKFVILEIRKFPYEKLTFFPGNLEQKVFLFYTLITLMILHTEFGLIWTTPWSDEKDLFLKLVIREIRKFPYEILTFFLGNRWQKLLFVLYSNFTGNTPYPIWFDLENSLVRWKRPIFKICYSANTQSSVWNTYFLPRQAISKILCFTL